MILTTPWSLGAPKLTNDEQLAVTFPPRGYERPNDHEEE